MRWNPEAPMDGFHDWHNQPPPPTPKSWWILVLAVFGAAIVLIGLGVFAFGHEAPSGWKYPDDCCGGRHCHPVACEELSEDRQGNVHWKNLVFEYTQIRMSGDRTCHVCHAWSDGQPSTPMCVFLLPMT